MKKKLIVALVAAAGVVLVARIAALPDGKFKAGDPAPALDLTNIHGAEVKIPDAKMKWVHLQFRRFAGCPICNLHLRSFVKRNSELVAAGIHEVVLFHSPKESLLPYQGSFPFDVIGDPDKQIYREFGVGSSIFAILDVRAWPAIVKGNSLRNRPKGDPEGGPLGLPADFLIDASGKIAAGHYGSYADDDWSVDEVLALAK